MKSFKITDVPNIQKREFGYRDINSSDKLNEQQEEVFRDILLLFNKANALEREISTSSTALTIESTFYNRKIISMQEKIEELKEILENKDSDIKRISKTAAQATVNGDKYDASIDYVSGDITSSLFSSVSKTRIQDDAYDSMVVPEQLKVMIGPDKFYQNDHVLSVEDNEVNNMFDGDESTLWIRKIITDTSVNSVENEIVIGLPENIVTTRAINQVIIDPFPTGSFDIQDVMTKNNGSWTRIPEFGLRPDITEDIEYDVFDNAEVKTVLKESGKLKLCFADIFTNQLKIKIKQNNFIYDAENDRRIWYIGMKNVDVKYVKYIGSLSCFSMVYDFKETDKNIRIYDTNIILNNERFDSTKASAFNITKEYFSFDGDGNTHKISATTPFVLDGHKLMIKFTIQSGKNQNTPCVRKCTVLYKTF